MIDASKIEWFDPFNFIHDGYISAIEPVRTYLTSVDSMLSGGMQPGVWCVMAEPGAGKSAFGLQMALLNAIAGKKVAYLSLEMPAYQCWARIASAYAYSKLGQSYGCSAFRWSDVYAMGIEMARSVTNEFGLVQRHLVGYEGYEDAFTRASNVLTNQHRVASNLMITDMRDAREMENIRVFVGAAKMNGASAVVIDYMQQMNVSGADNVYDRVTAISSGLKDVANDLGIVIVAIVSMNRNSMAGGKPTMHAGSGSAAIEYDAAGVMCLKEDEDARTEDSRRVELHVLKNRFGRSGCSAKLEFLPQYNIFEEVDE